MSVSEGMDLAKIRDIADQIRSSGQRVADLRREGDAQVDTLVDCWAGPDVDVFTSDWQSQAGALDRMAEALRGAAQELDRQASDQDSTSQGAGPASGGGGRGGAGESEPPMKGEAKAKSWWDKATDGAKDFGKGILDKGKDAVDTVADGAKDAFKATKEGAKDLVDATKKYFDNVGDAAGRHLDAWKNFGGQFSQIFTEGRLPRVSEVVASGAQVLGTGIGVGANVVTGDDHNILNDGKGEAGDVTEVGKTPVSNDTGTHPPVREPKTLSDVMRGTSDAGAAHGKDSGNVRVTEITKADGSKSYIVNVPGTEGWDPRTGGNPVDGAGNLSAVSGEKSAGMEAVEDAMRKADIPPGAPVMMVGHSQGGIITNGLLSDPAFTEKYNVTHSVTNGSPVDSMNVPPDVKAMNMQHGADPVPRLDMGDSYLVPGGPGGSPFAVPNPDQMVNGNGPNATRVVFDSPGGPTDVGTNHSNDEYATSASKSDDPAVRAYERSMDDFLVKDGDGSKVTAKDVELKRDRD